MLHVLFDNQAHESTGGQFTVSSGVDFPLLAKAFGYPEVSIAADPASLKNEAASWFKSGGLKFIHVPIAMGTPGKLGRPKVKPPEVAERFMRFIQTQKEGTHND
jgi:phosphonopyruvate decarboxylase